MGNKLAEIAERVRTVREILDITLEDMAQFTNLSVEEYLAFESGEKDFTFTFLYRCSEKFGIDMIELLTGERPKLSFYSIVRKDKGLPMSRRDGFTYNHLAYLFQDKTGEPFLVNAPYREEEQHREIELSYHEGQEFDYILRGSLKVRMEDHIEVLHEGDAIYYNSGHGHGMIATEGEDCLFLAVVMKPQEEKE